MPSLEVRLSRGGHPPVTEREREIRLNGTGGVKLYRRPNRKVRAFLFQKANAQRPTLNIQHFNSDSLTDPHLNPLSAPPGRDPGADAKRRVRVVQRFVVER